MEHAREHEADGDAAFDDRRYDDAVHAYEQALDAYDEALAGAREVGDQELVDEAEASIDHVEDGIGDARRERAYEDFSSLADTAEYELEEADRLLEEGTYDEAREAYEVARDRASEAIDVTEDWGFEDPEHLVDVRSSAASGITDASLAAAEHDVERAADQRHEAPEEAVADLESVVERLDEMVLTADRAEERDELLEDARELMVRCELNAARGTIAEAEQLEDAGDLHDAKAVFQEARDQLRDVSDSAVERGMQEARETASDLVDTCAEGIERIADQLDDGP